jgi:hypothetical protein
MQPHSKKPFPGSFYTNCKFKPRHYFVFDVLCRHLEASDDGWIFTNSKDIISLVKEVNGISIEAVTPIIKAFEEFGYIKLIWNDGYRSVSERFWSKTDYEIKILDSAWDRKDQVKAPLKDPEIRKARYYAKKI